MDGCVAVAVIEAEAVVVAVGEAEAVALAVAVAEPVAVAVAAGDILLLQQETPKKSQPCFCPNCQGGGPTNEEIICLAPRTGLNF